MIEVTVSDSMEQGTNRTVGPVASEKTLGSVYVDNPRMTARNVDVFYGDKQAIVDVSLDIGSSQVISFIGPSGCGKSTFLRCFDNNRCSNQETLQANMHAVRDACTRTKKIDSSSRVGQQATGTRAFSTLPLLSAGGTAPRIIAPRACSC